ncbi:MULTISPECIES: hypothetical protein [Nonomuraea]|uniref:Uncharacterized protein n=1 Tax=Nonomuraea mangrovi TaxID=2316207 RepID=A0ABW4T108_9ACTN
MPTLTTKPALPPSTRRTVVIMYVGLALTLIAMLVPLADLAIGDTLSSHVRDVYSAYLQPDQVDSTATVLLTYLLVTGALGVLSWWWLIVAVRRRRRWARVAATIVLALAGCAALVNLFAEEYGRTIVPAFIGLTGLLPCLAGLAAVVLLWRRDPASTSA